MTAKIVELIVSVTFSKMLSKTLEYSPSSSIFVFSNEKVENVVRAPRKPVITKALYSGWTIFSKYRAIKPMIKLPKTFTVNVPMGKNVTKLFCTNPAIKNLLIAPKNPPNPIYIRSEEFIC